MRAVLLDCEKIELLAADIYQQLANQPDFSKEVRETFARLAEDEREHASQFLTPLQLPEEALGMVKRISGEKVVEALAEISRVARDLDRYRASEEAALKIAIELENRFVRFHLNNAIHFTEHHIAKLFENLGRGDAAHLETLRECLTWWHAQRKPEN